MATVVIEENWSPSNKNSLYIPSKLARYSFGEDFTRENKDTTPLDIINNIEGERIYQDLHLEVTVKNQAQIEDYVHCFDLSNLGTLGFFVYNVPYYKTAGAWQANYSYTANTVVYYYLYGYNTSNYYMCIQEHTSSADFFTDLMNGNWSSVENSTLNINKNINENNYQEDFPYVGELVFKNLWGCDRTNSLQTYVKESNLLIYYPRTLSPNLVSNQSNYSKFFDKGTFKTGIDYGLRLILGESFEQDDILGDTKLNNYFSFSESNHSVGSDWNPSSDSTISNYFPNYSLNYPFDHYYRIVPYRGLPFFKEKIFDDTLLRFYLEKKDALGNIYQRIVNIPINLIFTNNLIKCYFKNSSGIYTSEYLNSNSNNQFSASTSADVISCSITVWCPNVERLTASSTILNCDVRTRPELRNKNGQLCELYWEFNVNGKPAGSQVLAYHTFEYSDGENYDKFIFFETITMV